MALEEFFFFFFGALVITGTLGTVLSKNPVSSALFLVLNFFALGGLYLSLEAQFIAVVQVIVYAGAIMVLFLFTIMLLSLEDESSLIERFDLKKGFAFLISGVFLVEILYIVGFKLTPVKPVSRLTPVQIGDVKTIGKALLTEYVFPFEIISIVLLLAIIGAVLLAKRKVIVGKTAV
ncbi:NADH-ubiquinone/plastoquinone oxidoreductase chain 6 [Chloroherpeton thalassium ATCC 35110]|uniref:NADH-quinone oxidoreductase subunit J n=1 Tax=Chloroherpeton thalassium (strain ATCC 35110 / GB-78) TaxID=517418 RepID=B3QTA2_CHLT3|nr:NADH-quinone oxidoreductase subunit J [Chloroherpeton thalassium]ACF14201.1 NADH-ubiquinone/plastoquinone oxidoreductase chain 6 [Chloroherpeton thalassium ATCC 35110]